jgi:hypothetical protein
MAYKLGRCRVRRGPTGKDCEGNRFGNVTLRSQACARRLGIMHEACDGSSAFVFDMMEPERPRRVA